ncbi:toll/interleukin-1 receptor domain-containing protein [uncultured Phocaeicola sp.]|uniref:toll/interleukin-1 receptor domain-containing protein n=1 Tax=uncultured Phocaeicola sp. TaxID=990718 RepID=UPI002615EA67|nr:TIR domain-containing protein [uncultured Phocaeicola sp.]
MEDQFEYDVALSFAGEQREYVERVAKFLKSKDIRVFYDRDVQSVLWGKNLSVALEEIYLDKAQYCIIFISSDYAKKEWTCLEVSAAMERMLHNRPKRIEYILPVQFDKTKIPGIGNTLGYLDGTQYTPEEIGQMVLEKLRGKEAVDKEITVSEAMDSIRDRIVSCAAMSRTACVMTTKSKALTEIRFLRDNQTVLYLRIESVHTQIQVKLLLYISIGEPEFFMDTCSARIIFSHDDKHIISSIECHNLAMPSLISGRNIDFDCLLNSLRDCLLQMMGR